MRTKVIMTICLFLLMVGKASAQWSVIDPTNIAQSIINSSNNIVHTSSTAQNMINYSGVPISPSDGAVSSGADKKWYLYRVSDMKKFIIKHIGGTPLKGSTANSFKGKKGVIVFNDCNWSDATGHVDLFNGIQCEYEEANDYFNKCNSELLYTLK